MNLTRLLTISLLLLPHSAHAASFTPLGVLPGGDYAAGLAVSADGSVVVGGSWGDEAGHSEAFRWSGGSMSGLGYLSPGDEVGSEATAMSDDGELVVGWSESDGVWEAVQWTGGTMSGLGVLPGSTYSMATGVSADGRVIVGESNGASG